MTWHVRLRSHDGGEILERASFGSSSAAMNAYRQLLSREELVGQPLAAVLRPPAGVVSQGNNANWFSRFDRELGRGRIGPDDPRLDPYATPAEAYAALNTPLPSSLRPRSSIDWEADERPFADVCKAWAKAVGGRDQAATALRVSRKTFDGWCDGRGAGQEAMARRLMSLTDRVG